MLTEAKVRNAKPSDRPMKMADGGGLYLSVMLNGGRCWRFDYRFQGKRKTLALGNVRYYYGTGRRNSAPR